MNRVMVMSGVALVVVGMVGCAVGTPLSPSPPAAAALPGPGPTSSILETKALPESRQYLTPESTLLASLPFPRHLVASVVLVVKWLWVNSSLIILGAVSMLGLCSLTPFCAISFTKFETLPELPEGFYRSLTNPTILKQAQNMVDNAIDKYNSMQE